jgi:hypothetical protein
MIKNLSSISKYMYVHGVIASTYINNHTGSQDVGNVRYNTSGQHFEVWDGISWVMITMDTPVIGLSPEAESLLDWAKKKRDEEEDWERLSEHTQAVRKALDNMSQSRCQVDITAKLARTHERLA